MSNQSGASIQIAIIPLQLAGTVPGTSVGYIVPFRPGESIGAKQPLEDSDFIDGSWVATEPDLGQEEISGDIEIPILTELFPWILKYSMGDLESTGAGDPYTHVAHCQQTIAPFAIEKGLLDITEYHLYMKCLITGWTIELKPSGIASIKFSIRGTNVVDSGAAAADSYVKDETGKVNWRGMTLFKEGGSSFNVCTGLTLTLDNDADAEPCLGAGGIPDAVTPGKRKLTGNMKFKVPDYTIYDKAKDNTITSLQATIPLIGAGHSLDILVNELMYEYKDPTATSSKAIVGDLNFNAFMLEEDDGPVIITAINGKAGTVYATPAP